MIIAIDGPSGTGKSTVAKEVARRLGFAFFDTGAMYRSLAWWVIQEKIDPSDEASIVAALPRFHYDIRSNSQGERAYFVNGSEVTKLIRTQSISMAASQVAMYPDVRHAMVRIQRKYGSAADVVFEGRDMGTVVFPDADLKIFLTAKPEIRAQRRFRELVQKFPDQKMSAEALLKEMEERDRADETRAHSPLKQAKDAILIDTSHFSAEEVVQKVIQLKPKRKFPPMKFSYRLVYLLAKGFFKCCFRLRIYGQDHFHPGAAIIAANHASFYDPPVLSISCPEEVHFLAKGSLFDIPGLGHLIRMLNSHPVGRAASDTQTFRTMIELLSQGKKLIIFPEGQRSFDGQLLPLERGLAFLVQKARCRIIPAYIAGSFEAWPRLRRFPKIFGRMTVVFGSPLEWEDHLDKKAAQERITERTEEAIRALKAWCDAGAQGNPP